MGSWKGVEDLLNKIREPGHEGEDEQKQKIKQEKAELKIK
jgi:hypothetical protein